jgi:spoIIIJ-associated protein
MGFSGVTVTAKETDEDIFFEINCEEDYGNIIGRRGETLDALQYLTRLFVNRFENNDKRVALNVGDYRSRREETLRALAKRQANKVLKYKKSTALEPMNPYERRIIHTAIQEIEGVTSHSVGEGDRRRVVITPEGGERRGNGRGDRRGNGRQKRAPYVPETPAEPREKKVDVSTSLYGRIEPKKKPEETTAE